MRRLLWLLPLAVSAAERWQVQYFYDEDETSLTLADLQFPSARRGIALGAITDKRERVKPVVLLSSDGGQHWTQQPLKEPGRSLFFLDDSLGWMVGEHSLWKTEESGRSWQKMKSPGPDLLRVYFVDAKRGWAVGARKSVFFTEDGGITWAKLAAAAEPKAALEYTTYNWIEFTGKQRGIILGSSRPPRRAMQRLPDWVDPEAAARRREWPALTITLDSGDAGKTWLPGTASVFGSLSRLRLSPAGWGLGLVEYFDAFDWPAEVFLVNWKQGGNQRLYRANGHAVTDVAITPSGTPYLAGFELTGKVRRSPVPGKVKVVRSKDLKTWETMDIDYRATARQVWLAAPADDHVWMATDTGMILKLMPAPQKLQ